jgi:hypothetical protein
LLRHRKVGKIRLKTVKLPREADLLQGVEGKLLVIAVCPAEIFDARLPVIV